MEARQLTNIEKEIVDEILSDSGLSASKFGLRFDRVVVSVLGRLRSFAEAVAPPGVTILVTISAPIRLPAKTTDDLRQKISALIPVGTPHGDQIAKLQGNNVRVRFVEHASKHAPKLVGFVHNPSSEPKPLLDLAEHWLGSHLAEQ